MDSTTGLTRQARDGSVQYIIHSGGATQPVYHVLRPLSRALGRHGIGNGTERDRSPLINSSLDINPLRSIKVRDTGMVPLVSCLGEGKDILTLCPRGSGQRQISRLFGLQGFEYVLTDG